MKIWKIHGKEPISEELVDLVYDEMYQYFIDIGIEFRSEYAAIPKRTHYGTVYFHRRQSCMVKDPSVALFLKLKFGDNLSIMEYEI